ncbi:MAG: peptidase M15 [Gammaproteobacteria bacterium]|nr:peptidase M15 [Gammaproteobacteria bacterium]
MNHLKIFLYCSGIVFVLQGCSDQENAGGADNYNGFYAVNTFVPGNIFSIQTDVRYATSDNFVGEPIDGYGVDKALMTLETALTLAAIQIDLSERGLGLKVFDAYRPQRAVDHFVLWASDTSDTRTKQKYYPNVPKGDLFEQGYIASRSAHSRGSTVDLTLIDLESGIELDMGSSWDFFDLISWSTSLEVSLPQKNNREILREIMLRYGFVPIAEEWWHFTLEDEPFPDTYFDYPID